MARNHTTTKLFGATERTDLEGVRPPTWMTEFNPSAEMSIGEWAGGITQHKIVNVAYGEGSSTEDFEMSNSTRMVVTMSQGEEVSTVSDRFNLVDNPRVISTAVDVIENLDLDTAVFGEGRDYKNKFVVDLFFDDDSVVRDAPDDDVSKMAYGISIAAANDKSSSVRACPTIWDGHSETLIRGIGEGWSRVKHTKPEDVETKDIYDKMAYMFTEIIVGLEDVADEFTERTEKAESFVVDFGTEEFTPSEFYETWLGETVPQKVVDASVERSQIRAGVIEEGDETLDDPKMSMWSLVSGFTYSYTYESSISDGPTKRRYHEAAKDALENPENTMIETRQQYIVNQQEDEEDDSQEEMDLQEKTATTQEELRQMSLVENNSD
jgi:hypothetical protein